MNRPFPYDIAVRAASVAERREIVHRLAGPPAQDALPLSAFDTWRIDKLAAMLGTPLFDDSFIESSTPPPDLKDDYVQLLTAYRRWEAGFGDLDDEGREVVGNVASSWLPTYRKCLESFESSSRDQAPAYSWRSPETYHGRLAIAAEPFLLALSREVSTACRDANGTARMQLFGDDFGQGWHAHFLERFELMLTWALEAEKNVYCATRGIRQESATTADFLAFLDHTFASAETYHAFYLRFPMLGRWLAQVTRLLCDNAAALVHRLAADAPEISSVLFGGRNLIFSGVQLGKGDPHAGGQTVGRIGVDVGQSGDSERSAFIYKPRSLLPDLAVQSLLGVLRDAGAVPFPSRRLIAKERYGYEEMVPPGRNHVSSKEEAERAYEQLGGYLGVFHVLGGGDLHFENVLVADGQVHVCDCETVLSVRPRGQIIPLETMLDSVYSTGLLEWPRGEDAQGSAIRISGYAGGDSYALPFSTPRVGDRRMSMAMGVRHQTGLRIEPDGANRVWMDGRLLPPAEFRQSIVAGFESVHRWFEDHQGDAIRLLEQLFEAAPVRFINWATQVYSHLLTSLRHPKCLIDPLEVESAINKLFRHRRKWDREGVIAAHEAVSLWKLDIPLFSAEASGLGLTHDQRYEVGLSLEATPLQDAADRVRRLSGANRRKQVQYIAASLPVEGDESPEFVASCLDYAGKVGRKLLSLMETEPATAPWRSLQLLQDGPAYADIPADLYGGGAGIALFLGYLDALAPDPEVRAAAQRAMSHALDHRPSRLGAFNGLAGLVYAATHLSCLWGDAGLLDRAIELARQISGRIDEDREYDVLGGAAGIIAVMTGLSQVAGEGLDCAHLCAAHLRDGAEPGPAGLSWPLANPGDGIGNLTGFAHGSGGIGWALISLASLTGREEYLDLGRKAFAYENHHFDSEEKDWHDLRTSILEMSGGRRHFANVWCNGSAGIGLSRIASWAALGRSDEQILRDAHLALGATLRSFHTLRSDCLCHGRCGNAELFLRFSRLRGEPAFELEARQQVQAQWQNFDKEQTLAPEVAAERQFPGLMLGFAGYGMHFLRLAHPDRVPSPLLLDPVPGVPAEVVPRTGAGAVASVGR